MELKFPFKRISINILLPACGRQANGAFNPSVDAHGRGGISLIDKCQPEVVEKILRHCGLWKEAVSRSPPVKSTVAEPEPCYDYGYFDRVCI